MKTRKHLSKNAGGHQTKDLKLPIIKVPMKEPKSLSMDEYLKFVEFNLKHTVDLEFYRKQKKLLAVDVPFRIE